MNYYSYNEKQYANIDELIGKTIKSIKIVDECEIQIICEDGDEYVFYHEQDCCESVYIESIGGDIQNLVGKPIIMADESCNSEGDPLDKWDESFTWTFYRFATIKGYVDIRWYGESNGCYSESVDFIKLKSGSEFE